MASEPRGVVGAIVPWNFPLANASIKVAPALAAANSVVVKPSEVASLSAIRLAELATEADLPAGVLNVVTGGAATGAALGRNPDVDFLSFTGETNGKPLLLECGGKSAQIVCADMAPDLAQIAKQCTHDAFWNIGQWCAARTRLLVEQPIFDAFMNDLIAAAELYRPGDPLDDETNYGVMASKLQFDKVVRYCESGIASGASVALLGDRSTPLPTSIAPTILTDVLRSSEIWREEIFGPVLIVSPFASFSEAIAMGQ